MLLAALLVLLPATGFLPLEVVDGVTVESRPVDGSDQRELRFTTVAAGAPEALCAVAFGTGRFDPGEPFLESRQVLSENADERVTYDRIAPAVLSNRDYGVRARRSREGGGCRVEFEAANDLAPRPEKGYVRITRLNGSWSFEPLPGGQTRITHVIFTDLETSLPAFLVESGRRSAGLHWVQRVIAGARGRAGTAGAVPPAAPTAG